LEQISPWGIMKVFPHHNQEAPMRKPNGLTLKPIETVVFAGQIRPKTFLKVSAYDESLKCEIIQHVRLIPFLLRIRLRLAIRACYVISRKLRKVAKHVPISFA
jgi:hypothetical protein